MSDNNKTGSGQSQNKGNLKGETVKLNAGDAVLNAEIGKPKESCEFTHKPVAAQPPPPKPQAPKNIKKDK